MSTNPYLSPDNDLTDARGDPESTVRGPATGLIVVSIICIVVVSLAMLFSGFLLISGTARRMRQPSIGVSKETQIAVRMVWSGVILSANAVILIAGIKMRRLQNYSLSKLGAILAVVPCIGPCYVLGIPFGIWALVALSKPGVKDAFR